MRVTFVRNLHMYINQCTQYRSKLYSKEPVKAIMKTQIFLVAALFGIALAQHGGHYEGHEHYNHHPEYKFEYSVHDPHTHDMKSQHETRHGDVVKGFYKLKDADGTIREVHCTADHKNGFNAEVHRSGHAYHPEHYHSSSQSFYGKGGHGHASSTNNNNLYNHHF